MKHQHNCKNDHHLTGKLFMSYLSLFKKKKKKKETTAICEWIEKNLTCCKMFWCLCIKLSKKTNLKIYCEQTNKTSHNSASQILQMSVQ